MSKTAIATRRIKLAKHNIHERRHRSKEEMQACRDAIVDVLQIEHPMTLRAVFYRLVSRAIIAKLESEYGKLSRMLCQMREAGTVPWEWVVDNTRRIDVPGTDKSVAQTLQYAVMTYTLDPWLDQPERVYVMCEKDAIANVLASVTHEYIVPLAVVRGFSSHTFLHDIAGSISRRNKPTHVFYFGDHDPSGLAVSAAAERIIRHFAPDVSIRFKRLAVTPEQISEYNLMTRPTKKSDKRSKTFRGESVEVDAMPMDVLRTLTREAIESVLDQALYEETQQREESDRNALQKFINKHRG